ncbi:hypothetical protein HUK80_04150 [Flavobacterium sp. MAH-1]|uniref:Lipoprotein n=1 Tax=Flavobacterium agri TaxID=2743471 RepID=A0A7Y8Y0E4_9FLAO|nr:hypothetical protein [Flavobacterium agri]NUY80076.1 hypothetical protein [Flavobacterium agri]NYA70101.1 hypothetical protein [Flavobacterium agri]
MKKLLIFFVSIALVSCQKTKTDETPAPSEQEAQDNCDKVLRLVALQSGLDLTDYKTFFVRIESEEDDNVTIQVYVENEVENEQKNESTIAWLKLIPSSKELFDISADPENPKKMHLNEKLFDDLVEWCQIEVPKIAEVTEEGMGFTEKAVIKNKTIEQAYIEYALSKEFEDATYWLANLPKKDTVLHINNNENALIDIDYKIWKDSIGIYMLYQGGSKDFTFSQVGKDVMRVYVDSAD